MSELPEKSENPQRAVVQPPLVQRLRDTALASNRTLRQTSSLLGPAADRIETLERTLADYIDKSEKLVYGAHGNAYLPGQMRTWLKATHDGKNVVSNSPENSELSQPKPE